jgi:hypothetical protein
MEGCAHAAMCGFDVCKMFNINCANVTNMFDCVLNCVNGLSCQQLFMGGFACYQMCQGDGGPPPFDGGPPPFDGGFGDGGPAGQCGQCALQSCQMQSFACFANPACMPWGQCAVGCFMGNATPGCFAACDAMYPMAKTNYDPVYSCLCTSCSTQCSAADPCAAGQDGGP